MIHTSSLYRTNPKYVYELDLLNHIQLDTNSQKFLIEYGLPHLIWDGTELKIKVLENFQPLNLKIKGRQNRFIKFGESEFGDFCVQSSEGAVYLVDESQNSHFVNSSIKCFILFIIIYIEIRSQFEGFDKSGDDNYLYALYENEAKFLEKEFAKFDPRAIVESAVWSFRLEEIRNGAI